MAARLAVITAQFLLNAIDDRLSGTVFKRFEKNIVAANIITRDVTTDVKFWARNRLYRVMQTFIFWFG